MTFTATHVIVLWRKVRMSSGRSRGRRPVGQEVLGAVVHGRGSAVQWRRPAVVQRWAIVRDAVVVRSVVGLLVSPLGWSRFIASVSRPRYDAVGRVGVLSEHTALERLAGL